jgi:3-oxoacyl-[acyl-carrier protein] reductase
VAILTGGCHPEGRAIALALARSGYALALAYLIDQAAVEELVEQVLATGGSAVAVRADGGDALDVQRLFAEADEALGPVDVVVHVTPAVPWLDAP